VEAVDLRRLPLAFCVLAAAGLNACGREAVKNLIDETRAPVRVIVEIRLEQTEQPSEKDLQLRRAVADAIEHEHIGIVARSTSDVGRMTLAVDVKNSVTAIPVIHDVLRKFGIDERSTVRIDEEHS
jgi:hypothetical protein